MCKWLLTSLGLNPLITGSISIEAYLTLCEKLLISCLGTSCGNQLKCILEYIKLNYDLWNGPCIGAGF